MRHEQRTKNPKSTKTFPPKKGAAHPQRAEESHVFTIPKSWRCIGGQHAILEALKVRPKQCKALLLRQEFESSQDLQSLHDLAKGLRVRIEIKHRNQLEKIFGSHQGAILYVDGAPTLNLDQVTEPSVFLILDGLEDPHNLGAILRTSWLQGVHGIYIPRDRSTSLTPSAHKVASGGAEHVPVIEVTSFETVVKDLRARGYWIFGLDGKGPKSLFQMQMPSKVVWIIGNEEKGLRKPTMKLCDEIVALPQVSADASFNASVATAITLSETYRQIGFPHLSGIS